MSFFKRSRTKYYHGPLVLSVLGFSFFFIACYPGFMSPDSLEQYRQAQSLQFADGHPPIMAWLWSKLDLIWAGPQGLLMLQLLVLWVGLYIWSKNAGEKPSSKWFVLLGFAPWVASFEGVLWKDMGMAFSLLLAIAMLERKTLGKLKLVAIASLLLYAFMVRGNAPAALIPVVWYAFDRIFPLLRNYQKTVATILSLASMFIFLSVFNYQFLEADRNHMVSYVMVDDLVHLSQITDRSLLPGVDLQTLRECSEKEIGDTKLVGRLFCLGSTESYQSVAPIPYEKIKKEWFSAIQNYPLEYASFRLRAYLYLMRDPSERPYIYSFSGIYPNDMGLVQSDNLATSLLKNYVKISSRIFPFLFKPYWWLILGLLLLVATMFVCGDRNSLNLIRVLLLSGLLYMFSYIPFTPMADFRYVYWSTLAISLAVIKYLTSTLSLRLSLLTFRSKLHKD